MAVEATARGDRERRVLAFEEAPAKPELRASVEARGELAIVGAPARYLGPAGVAPAAKARAVLCSERARERELQ